MLLRIISWIALDRTALRTIHEITLNDTNKDELLKQKETVADETLDIERGGRLPDYRLLPNNVQPGEVLALLNSGAYSLAQMFHYNGRPLPAAVLIDEKGAANLIRRRDTYEDLLTNDVW